MRPLYPTLLLSALLAAPALAFDLNSMLDSVNQTLNNVKSLKDNATSLSGSTAVSGDHASAAGESRPRISQSRPTPLAPTLEAHLDKGRSSFKEMDESTLFLSRPTLDADNILRADKLKTLRGVVYHTTYDHPHAQSTLQVWESYRKTLDENGYTVDFRCDKPCLSKSLPWENAMDTIIYDKSDRYLVAHKGNSWVALLVGEISEHPVSVVHAVEAEH